MSLVTVERRGPVEVLRLDNPPVNGLGSTLRRSLMAAVEKGLADPGVAAFVITGSGRMYSAGADIREFNTEAPAGTPDLNDVIAALELSAKPVISAIHGVAAGGGLELALGTHHRIAARTARVGLPEVTLGLLPGAGGTQRLPRLIAVDAALDLITSGRLVPAAEALRLGLLDENGGGSGSARFRCRRGRAAGSLGAATAAVTRLCRGVGGRTGRSGIV